MDKEKKKFHRGKRHTDVEAEEFQKTDKAENHPLEEFQYIDKVEIQSPGEFQKENRTEKQSLGELQKEDRIEKQSSEELSQKDETEKQSIEEFQKTDETQKTPAEEKEKQGVKKLILGFISRAWGDHIGAYAAQAAYFLILSFIPFVLCLTTLIRYTPLTYNMISDTIRGFVPDNLQTFVLSVVAEVYDKSLAVVPITALAALWSAGKAIQSLINGLNTIYHVKETRNWLTNRIYAIGYTVLFEIAIVFSLLLLVLGKQIQEIASEHVPILGRMIGRIIGARTLLVFVVLFFIFLVLYKALPNRKASFKSQVPGALIIAISWSIFSFFFSLYFELFPDVNNMYGSLTALIMVMLWLDICMNMVLYGAEVNAYFEKQFRKAQASVMEMLTAEKGADKLHPAEDEKKNPPSRKKIPGADDLTEK